MCNRPCVWILLLLVLGGGSQLPAKERALRRQDDRVPVDANLAIKNGIQRYDSKYLILYSDIEPEKARDVVGLVDQVYPAWESFFGELPPARDRSEFQITGYLMRDPTRFQNANLLRGNVGQILHGRSEGYEFWMHDQGTDYYRAHLLLHEATHCFTMCQETDGQLRPHWFIEGIAEYFGTHEVGENAAAKSPIMRFGMVPSSEDQSLGFGRIEMIRAECEEGRGLSADEVRSLGLDDFSESRTTPYAWSWAFCTFLATHPLTAKEFRMVCRQADVARFQRFFDSMWKKHNAAIAADWELYRESLCYGFDLPRGATIRKPASMLASGESRVASVQAAGGWQSTGVGVTAGQSIQLTAQGRVTLAQTTKPWISEANGISIRYADSRPIGRLQAAIERTSPAEQGAYRHWVFQDIGSQSEWMIPDSGVLYLRVNDRWNELSDNSGEYQVTVTSRKE